MLKKRRKKLAMGIICCWMLVLFSKSTLSALFTFASFLFFQTNKKPYQPFIQNLYEKCYTLITSETSSHQRIPIYSMYTIYVKFKYRMSLV